MERVNSPITDDGWETRCVHGEPMTEPCLECNPPAGEFTDAGPDDVRFRVSRETEHRSTKYTEQGAVFAELGVWSPSAADYRRWDADPFRKQHFYGEGPDWYEWLADDSTWD